MSRPLMVDSCWYIAQLRDGIDPLRTLSYLAESRDIATCGVIKTEVVRGIKHFERFEKFQRAWNAMLYVESSSERWDETMNLAWSLDRRGIVLPLQDIHIAVCASSIGAVVLTYDKHFSLIPGIDATDKIY